MSLGTGAVDSCLGAVLAVLPDAALEVSESGHVLAANELALALFACSREQLIGRPLEPLLPVDGLLTRVDQPVRARLEGRRANGVPVLVDTSVRYVSNGGRRRRLCVLRELNDNGLANEAQRYFDAAFDNAPIGMALFNCDGEYVRVNPALCRLLGRSQQDLLGRRDQELTHRDDRQADVDAAWEILAGRRVTHQCEKRFLRPDGTVVWTLANLTFLRDDSGRPLSWVGQFQDITARRAVEQELTESEERFRLAFDHAPVGIALVSTEGRWLRVNRALCELTGYSEGQLLASRFQDVTHPDDLDADLDHLRRVLSGEMRAYEMEKRYVRADGSVVWALLSVSLVRDAEGSARYFVSQIQDIDDRKRGQVELEHLAHHDALTGMLNRRAWDRALTGAIAHAQATGERLTVALLDLNAFKLVNDTHGHDAGDALLKAAALAWRSELREGDLLARVGGDEFAVLLPDCAAEHVDGIAGRLTDAVPHAAGCAIGIAAWRRGESAGELIRRADEALYADKARSRTAEVAAPVPAGQWAEPARSARDAPFAGARPATAY